MNVRTLLVLGLIGLSCAFPPVAPAASAEADKVVIFERDLLYDKIATNGADVVFVRGDAYKNVEVRVEVLGACAGLTGEATLQTVAPPPIPPAAIVTTFDCDGQGEGAVVGLPILPVYQNEDMPLVITFAGVGQAVVHLQVLGEPWS